MLHPVHQQSIETENLGVGLTEAEKKSKKVSHADVVEFS